MKLSLVVEGGGTRVAYSMGVLGALEKHYELKRVNFAVGCSSSLGLLAYYVAGQLYPGYHDWPAAASDRKFISFSNFFRGRPLLDIDYLIDILYKKKIPLSEKKIKQSRTKFFVPVVNAKNGKLKYFTNKTKENFFEVLRAGMAMQIGYGKTVKLAEKDYFDAGSLNPLPFDIPEIKKTRKIIILTKKKGKYKGHWSDDFFIKLFRFQFTKQAYEIIKKHGSVYKKKMKEVNKYEKNGDIVLRPKQYFSRYVRTPGELAELQQQGYEDTVNNKQIQKLISSLKKSKNADFYFK